MGFEERKRRITDKIHKDCRIINGHHFDPDSICRVCGRTEIQCYKEPYDTFATLKDKQDDIITWKLYPCHKNRNG